MPRRSPVRNESRAHDRQRPHLQNTVADDIESSSFCDRRRRAFVSGHTGADETLHERVRFDDCPEIAGSSAVSRSIDLHRAIRVSGEAIPRACE